MMRWYDDTTQNLYAPEISAKIMSKIPPSYSELQQRFLRPTMTQLISASPK